MRIDRKQLENLAEALKYTEADVFDLREEGGKIRLYAVESVERFSAVPITPQGFAQRRKAKA